MRFIPPFACLLFASLGCFPFALTCYCSSFIKLRILTGRYNWTYIPWADFIPKCQNLTSMQQWRNAIRESKLYSLLNRKPWVHRLPCKLSCLLWERLSCLLVNLTPWTSLHSFLLLRTPTTLQTVTFVVGTTVMSVGELYSVVGLESRCLPRLIIQSGVLVCSWCFLLRFVMNTNILCVTNQFLPYYANLAAVTSFGSFVYDIIYWGSFASD